MTRTLLVFLVIGLAVVPVIDSGDARAQGTEKQERWIKIGVLNIALGTGTRTEDHVGFMAPFEFGEFAFDIGVLGGLGIGVRIFEGAFDHRKNSDRPLIGNINSFVPLYLYLPVHRSHSSMMNLVGGRRGLIYKTTVVAFAGGSAWGVYNSYLQIGLAATRSFSLYDSDPISPFLGDPTTLGFRAGYFVASGGTAASGWFVGLTLGTASAFGPRR